MNYQTLHKLMMSLGLIVTTFMPTRANVSYEAHQIDNTTQEIELSIAIAPDDFLYKDYIEVVADHPEVTLSKWESSIEPVQQYDPTFKTTKKGFNRDVTLILQATAHETPVENAHLHFTYYQASKKHTITQTFALDFPQPKIESPEKAPVLAQAVDVENIQTQVHTQEKPDQQEPSESWSAYISKLVKTTESDWVRLALAFLLGLLLSLTPCIYPMIPITVGILQSQAKQSVLHNFLLSLAYTFGIAMTFSLLGLGAAYTGAAFGSIMSNPFFIITIAILLFYLAFSMFGFYEMYTPKFMQHSTNKKGSSIFSAFAFGAMSGTIASPCLSPGLLLLLSIVTTLGNKLMGFLLLFSFGIGLSIPLLIIGTFSSSLNVLPKAGMWMIEIKKIMGFILIGMSLYFLGYITPYYAELGLFSLFALCTGIYYLYASKTSAGTGRFIKSLVGFSLVVGSILLIALAYKTFHTSEEQDGLWLHDYRAALALAKSQNKKVFVDVGANFCSICKAIDKSVFKDTNVKIKLADCINVKLDGSDTSNPSCEVVQKKFSVVGYPTYILVDPNDEHEIKRWGSELYDMPNETFVTELAQHIDV